MRMIYCVRTTMVTSSSTNTTVTTVINKPQLEKNAIPVQTELNGPVNEARRLPEVTDEEGISGSEMVSSPTVDAWKATIKDHKVFC